MKKKILSLALASALCLSLTVPALAANQPGDTTVTDAKGNTYTLSNPILYTISKEQIAQLSFSESYVRYAVTGESHDPKDSALQSVTMAYAVPAGTTITVPADTTATTQDGSTITTTTTGFSLEPQIAELSKSGDEYVVAYEEYFPTYPYVLDASFENAFWVMECYETSSSESHDVNGGGGAGGSSSSYIGSIAFFVPTSDEFQNGFPVDSSSTDEPTSPSTPSAPVFSDVAANAYYADAVAYAVEKGITTGTSATTFSPEESCTRAQIITFLWRAAGSPEPKNISPFSDVKTDAYYAKAAAWAAENGMADGSTFSPDAPCTREMAVEFIWKHAGSPDAAQANFTDVSSAAVSWAVEAGVTSGTSATEFSPDDICTRGQIVTFLYRAFAE
mgnify:CR=1 FL=1